MGLNNRKGILFTATAILLITFFLISYSFYAEVKDRKAIQKRVFTLNNLVEAIDEDLNRQLKVSGFRTIFIFEKKIAERGEYISNFNSSVYETFFNGTFLGEEIPLMIGARYEDIIDRITTQASRLNINASLTNPSFSIIQSSPWDLKIKLSIYINLEDEGKEARYNTTKSIEVYLPIENFEDPMYVINTNGLVTNNISKAPFTEFVLGTNVSNLNQIAEKGFYINSTEAPSFIDRLEGKNSPSPFGIESLIYLPRLSAQGITVKDKSIVDHVYFSTSDPAKHHITGTPSWFNLDDLHLEIYGASSLAE